MLYHAIGYVTWPGGMSDLDRRRMLEAEGSVIGPMLASGVLRDLLHVLDEHIVVAILDVATREDAQAAFDALPMRHMFRWEIHPVVTMRDFYRKALGVDLLTLGDPAGPQS